MGAGQAAHWTVATIGTPGYVPAVLSDGRRSAEHFESGWQSNQHDLARFEDADLQGFQLTTLRTIPQMIEYFRELWSSNQLDVTAYTYSDLAPFRGPLLESIRSTSTPITIPDNTDLAHGFADSISLSATSDGATTVIVRLKVAHTRAADLRIGLDAASTPGTLGNLWDLQDDPTGTGIDTTIDVTATLGVDPLAGTWTIYGHDTLATNYGALEDWGVDTYDDPLSAEHFEQNWGNAPFVDSWDIVHAVSAGVDGFETWRTTQTEFEDADLTAAVFKHASGDSEIETFEDVSAPLACAVNSIAGKTFYAANHGFVIDDAVRFSTVGGGVLPSAVASDVDHVVTIAIGDDLFSVSQTSGGVDLDPVSYGFAPFYVNKTPRLYWTQILT